MNDACRHFVVHVTRRVVRDWTRSLLSGSGWQRRPFLHSHSVDTQVVCFLSSRQTLRSINNMAIRRKDSFLWGKGTLLFLIFLSLCSDVKAAVRPLQALQLISNSSYFRFYGLQTFHIKYFLLYEYIYFNYTQHISDSSVIGLLIVWNLTLNEEQPDSFKRGRERVIFIPLISNVHFSDWCWVKLWYTPVCLINTPPSLLTCCCPHSSDETAPWTEQTGWDHQDSQVWAAGWHSGTVVKKSLQGYIKTPHYIWFLRAPTLCSLGRAFSQQKLFSFTNI